MAKTNNVNFNFLIFCSGVPCFSPTLTNYLVTPTSYWIVDGLLQYILKPRQEKTCGHVATGCRNFWGLRKCSANSTELFSYMLLKVETLWKF